MPTKTTRSRGRPAFKPTAAQRRQVSVAAAGGMRQEDIAIALGIHRDTLAKYFEVELSAGAAMRRMEVLNALYLAAKKGSSAAAKAYLAADPALGVPPLPADPAPAAAPVKAAPKGKKEVAQEEAATAHVGTGWDDLLNPKSAPLQ